MTRRIVALLAVIAVVAIAIVVYAFLRPPDTATGPITAVPLTVEQTAVGIGIGTVSAESTSVPTAGVVVIREATPVSPLATPLSPLATPATEPTATPAPDPAAGPTLFEIVPAQSQAQFIIDEVLFGKPNTVVGATNQVAGEIAIDVATPANSQVGVITINARTLTTDNNLRNNAIKNRILRTNNYEFITFEPTAISGLPEQVTVGQPFSFQVTGNLTVTNQSHEVVFDVTVNPVATDRIEGEATTTVRWQDFGLAIPKVQSVDSVADDVKLQLQFVAVPKTS